MIKNSDPIQNREEETMKKRLLAFLLAVCTAFSMLVLPASASGSNAAVQTAITLGALTPDQTANLAAPLTRGQFARMLTAFSAQRNSVNTQNATGRLYLDLDSSSPYAPYVRTAVQHGWMSGYADGSFRPEQGLTLEEGCTMALRLLGYDVAKLGGSFPDAQLNKASTLGLRSGLTAQKGQGMTLEQGAVLLYNALTALNSEGAPYAGTLGLTVTDGKVDLGSVLLSGVQGPFVAGEGTNLPFAPAAAYRNDQVTTQPQLAPHDVYYYSEASRTLWIYDRKAAGRITAVSPTASAPTSVTVAGTQYTIASPAAAYQLSSLAGGGVGQAVTLLLGMDNEVVQVLTGEQADQVFYGVVQDSARTLTQENGASVAQAVTVACTDGVQRTVHVDQRTNYPAGWLVELLVDENGEHLRSLEAASLNGQVNENGTALGEHPFAQNIQILDTTAEGVAGTVRPSRLAGAGLSGRVRYYTTNDKGEIDRLILNDATGDLWEYGALDTVRTMTDAVGGQIDQALRAAALPGGGQSSGQPEQNESAQAALELKNILMPSTSDVLYGLIDGSILSSSWNTLSGSTGALAGYVLRQTGATVGGTAGSLLQMLGSGADYTCYVSGQPVRYQTSVKYPVVAGGVAIGKAPDGKTVRSMVQLAPVMLDRLGPGWAMSGSARYETADEMQVYLWSGGQYFATTLAQVSPENHHLIGWYDSFGCPAGKKVRILIAVEKA